MASDLGRGEWAWQSGSRAERAVVGRPCFAALGGEGSGCRLHDSIRGVVGLSRLVVAEARASAEARRDGRGRRHASYLVYVLFVVSRVMRLRMESREFCAVMSYSSQ